MNLRDLWMRIGRSGFERCGYFLFAKVKISDIFTFMFVKRKIQDLLNRLVKDDRILLLIGARQTGKTTLLRYLKKKLDKAGESVWFLTFEDPLFLGDVNEHPEHLFQYVPKPSTGQSIFVLLDEIQYLKDPSNFLKYIYDLYHDQIKLIVTGSSAFYLDEKFHDSLAGRKRIVPIYPFCFSEFLTAKNRVDLAKEIEKDSFFSKGEKRSLLQPVRRELLLYLQEYVQFGGYPSVVLEEDLEEKRMRLQELHFSLLKKDVADAGIKNEYAFYSVLKLLASQTGNLVNALELSNTVKVSRSAVDRYLSVLRKSFIIELCPPFHKNIRKELSKMPKYYFYDSGYRNVILNSFDAPTQRLDAGATVENIFFAECRKAGKEVIQFWRTQNGSEIDFILDANQAFEIKVDASRFSRSKYKPFTDGYPDISLSPVGWQENTYLEILDFCS